jgi:hypothetical protein
LAWFWRIVEGWPPKANGQRPKAALQFDQSRSSSYTGASNEMTLSVPRSISMRCKDKVNRTCAAAIAALLILGGTFHPWEDLR